MKRSEMIRIIMDALRLNDIYELDTYQSARKLLTVIENHGMLPPKAELKIEHDALNGIFHMVRKNEWEKEHERL